MKEEILKALKSIESVKILKGPVKKKERDTPGDTGEPQKGNEYYECILLINGQLLPVEFRDGDNVRQNIAEACKKWKISFLP